MPKAGIEYQELVALVAKALDPKADVQVGHWIEGPDGAREVDVAVRGTVEGVPHFVHIECKDWKRPVDIQAIDSLDSKRRDLSADAAMLFSNSGFTKKALRKAERVGIDVISAIAAGNHIIRPMIERELVAKRLSVESFNLILYPSKECVNTFPDLWDYRTLRYQGHPFANWLANLSTKLLQRHEGNSKIVETASFKIETPFSLDDISIVLLGFRAEFSCTRSWLSQTVREDVSLGLYNHITRRLTVPSKQIWTIGKIDQEAWNQIKGDDDPEEWTKPLYPGSFRLDLTLLNPVTFIQGEDTPPIDDLIGEHRTDLF